MSLSLQNVGFVFLAASIVLPACWALKLNCSQPQDRPVIGVLSQDYFGTFKNDGLSYSYIAASYVKFVESAGGRVVPIMVNKSDEYYEELFSNINGLLLPGGGQFLDNCSYTKAGQKLFSLAVKANDAGDYFPVWGTCLGFELLSILVANGTNWLTECQSMDKDSSVSFFPTYDELIAKSRLFQTLSPTLYEIMINQKVTINYHKKCLTKENFTSSGLDEYFNILAMDKDFGQMDYISVMEAKDYPFYGVQFHPEKNMFEFVLKKDHVNIPHDSNAIATSQYFGNFFVNEARKSRHFFDIKAEREELIYNFKPEYTIESSDFEQTYFFASSSGPSSRRQERA